MTALQKAGALLSRARSHWKTPPEGRYMNYKEICAYSFGGIGVYAIITIVGGMILSPLIAVLAVRLVKDIPLRQ